jgi:hypothetical protein
MSERERRQRSEQAQAGRYQGQADQFAQQQANRPIGQPTFPNDPFLQFQPGMVSPFSPEGIQQGGQAVAQNQFGQTLSGLTATQTEAFQRELDAASRDRDRALGDIGEQEAAERRRTTAAGRRTRASGAGEAADLQAAAAARGLMSSPASFDVGQDYIAGVTAAEQAGQQANLSSFLGQAERARSQVQSDYSQFMDDVRRQRLATQMDNERAQADRLMSFLGYV